MGKMPRKVQDVYAKYGVGRGAMNENGGVGDVDCGILAHGRWPGWALVLQVGNLKLRWIMGLRPELHATLESRFPQALMITENIVDDVFTTYPVTLVLCKRRSPIATSCMWSMQSLSLVLCAKKLQGKMPTGWHGKAHPIKHTTTGGATDGTWVISAVTRDESWSSLFDCKSNPVGNMISCIDQSVAGLNCPPLPVREGEPTVHAHKGVFCAMNGLYSCNTVHSENFLVPSYRLRTGWCIRPLNNQEIFSVWDVTPGLTLDLDDSDREELTRSSARLKISWRPNTQCRHSASKIPQQHCKPNFQTKTRHRTRGHAGLRG